MNTELQTILSTLIPFRFLSASHRDALIAQMSFEEVEAQTVILEKHAVDDQRLYFVLSGQVEVFDPHSHKIISVIDRGRYFGERAPLFDTTRAYSVRASTQVKLASLPAHAFLAQMQQDAAFAHSFGAILREKQGLFRAFDAFIAELMHGVSEDVVHFRELVRLYRRLEPALHHLAADNERIDFDALAYATRRLPENISSVYMLYLTDSMQEHLDAPSQHFRPIETPARRRVVYELTPGKLMIILRDGVSDLIDLLTCLCAYTVEAKKIRRRVQRPATLKLLGEQASKELTAEQEEALLMRLGFSPEERIGLTRLFQTQHTARKLFQIALHHEDFNIQITKQVQSYNSVHAEMWTDQIVSSTRALLGCTPDALRGVDVHIISSNTHSVVNCLGSYLFEKQKEIEEWGATSHPEIFAAPFHVREDRLFALARAWFKAFPQERKVRAEREREGGIIRLEDTALTGISVELIDLARVSLSQIDPHISAMAGLDEQDRASGLIVNIDYAFGQQAEEILSILLTLFGSSVRSVNILGKAGGLAGKRGDILVANSFVEQTQEILSDLPGINACELDLLREAVPDRSVYEGPVLTVAGTLLQNRVLLNFYKKIWGCVGLEMEGTYYLRELKKAMHLGVIPANIDMRFVYYISDVPLATGESLAGAMLPEEGIPPLYAITREILASVIKGSLPVNEAEEHPS